MQKQVLIPTDYSMNALNAIMYAFKLFANEECTFHIFHSYFLARSAAGNVLFPEPEPHEYDVAAKKSGENLLRLKEKIQLLEVNPKHTIYYDHQFGTFIELLQEKVDREKIDLIVMGTRGITDDIKVAYGRNSVNVMENIRTCPVLAIPANVTYKPIRHIAFPTNFKTHFNEREMNTFVRLASMENSEMQILHMGKEKDLSEKQKNNRKALENHFGKLEYSYHWLENLGVKEGVLSFADQQNSDLISFVNRKHWFFGSVFTNPLVKSLGVHSKVPVLALHDTRS